MDREEEITGRCSHDEGTVSSSLVLGPTGGDRRFQCDSEGGQLGRSEPPYKEERERFFVL